MSAILRKSITDLTRRRARAVFTVLTLALAVASVGIFAVPALMQQAMDREVATNRLADVSVTMEPLPLNAEQLAALARLPNVRAVEPRAVFTTRVLVGRRREDARIVGVPNFGRQMAEVVRIKEGAPRAGGLLVEEANYSKGDFTAAAARVVSADGSVRSLPVSGRATTLWGSAEWDFTTFYAPARTVQQIGGFRGYTALAFRLHDAHKAEADRTVAAIREQLRSYPGFRSFSDLPVIREPGQYPGKEMMESIISILNVITVLALLSALVLLSNTMTTLVGEQTAEIASMKAIGARRREIRRIYLRTAMLFGVLGTVAGVVLSIGLSNLITGYFASMFFGIDAGFGVAVPIVAACVVVGMLGPPLAALPAVRRAARLPLNEALQATGSAVGGQGRLDALLRRVGWLPRAAQIGLRSAGRRKRRTAATVIQVALAVGTCFALLSLGTGVYTATREWYDDNHFAVWVQPQGGRPLDTYLAPKITRIDGVTAAQPWLSNQIKIGSTDAMAWGVPVKPMFDTHVDEGEWYGPADVTDANRVAVLGKTLAKKANAEVGDVVRMQTGNGPAKFEVIGITANQAMNGRVAFVPITTLQNVLGVPGMFNNYFVATESKDHAVIDRVTTRLEDALSSSGQQAGTWVNYVKRQENIDANKNIGISIQVLGLLIVAISMVALVNTITMGVLERTREIGVLRSIGARGRDIRRIFGTEGLVVATAGWLAGIPTGYLMARIVGAFASNAIGIDIPFMFPLQYVAFALVGTVVIALLVMMLPLRRAARFKPGEALRYA